MVWRRSRPFPQASEALTRLSKFRTKKELARLIRELHPLPLVPDLVEPLRPELRRLRKQRLAKHTTGKPD